MHVTRHLPISAPREVSGIALVLVLWMLTLLSVIASNLVYSSRTDLAIAGNTVRLAQGEALADAGLHRAYLDLLRPQADPQRWKGDGLTHEWRFEDHPVNVTISDESAKIDINSASDALLKGLFLSQGVADTDAAALVDAVADWRDADDLRRLNGAEKDDYAAAGRTYVPANAPFSTIEELKQVLGMSEGLYRRVESQITVYSNQGGINSAIASREVLLALPGATPEAVDAYLLQRQTAIQQGLMAPPFALGQAFSANPTNNVFSIQVQVELENGIRFFREAVVRLTGDPKDPVAVLAWRTPTQRSDLFDLKSDVNRNTDGQ
jgi:general secretion pathway protein K